MAEPKTKATTRTVEDFLNAVEHEGKRKEGFQLLEIFKRASGEEAKMWGASIVGFGRYHYKYESGHEGDSLLVGFSPRKAKHSIYLMDAGDFAKNYLAKLGKHKMGKGCLYVNKLADIDLAVLEKMVGECADFMRKKWQ